MSFRILVALLAALPLAAQPEASDSGFKVTFGAKGARVDGMAWHGGVADPTRVRRVLGWHLHSDDRLRPPNLWDVELQNVYGDVAAPAVLLDLFGPEARPVSLFTRRGDIEFTPSEVPYGTLLRPPNHADNVAVERVPLPLKVSSSQTDDDSPALLRTRSGEYWLAWVSFHMLERDGFFYQGADEIMIARSPDGRRWSRPEPLSGPGDHFRVALGEDARGRIWCVYGEQAEPGTGNFNLVGRSLDQGRWSEPRLLTDDPRPDAFHRMAVGADGSLALVWAGFRDHPQGGRPQADILLRRLTDGNWGPEINVSQSPEDDWEPSVALDGQGRAWVAWDSYRGERSYDILLREVEAGRPGTIVPIAASPFAEMRADVAVDGRDRVWIAWEQGGANWGKDTGYENPNHGIYLKPGGTRIYPNGRAARLAVYSGGKLQQPAQDPADAAPDFLNRRLFQSPRLTVDAEGRVWALLRHQWRAAGRWGGHLFDFYATTWTENGWIAPILLPGSTGRQDTVIAAVPGPESGLTLAVVGDGRTLPVPLPRRNDVSTLTLDARRLGSAPADVPLKDFQAPASPPNFSATHPNEAADLARIREHRHQAEGRTWKIVRGDLHRHTETSMDGATDGTLYDVYRYALNAAELDFLGLSDHNYGQWLDTDEPGDPQSDSEYEWWRQQKAADLFHVPGRFTPLYGYERTTNFPLGHRNVFHARRGVFSLQVPKLNIRERPEALAGDPPKLWSYLRQTGGIGIPHTTATSMGTDWNRRDDEVIPVTEIYQGDRNSYETQGGPRSALPEDPGPGQGGINPHQNGLVWNALGAGYKMGFIASSDHYSTHISYANLIVPDGVTTREDLLDAIRNRRSYASTDNIVVDFRAAGGQQGAVIEASAAPELQILIEGTAPIQKVEIIKNNRVLYTRPGEGQSRLQFSFRDQEFANLTVGPTATVRDWDRPETGVRPRPRVPERYYYLRIVQSYSADEPDKPGEVAWSSPIYVRGR
ncbi:MAG: DUF3604 domain-containing protein [Acidobacteria bacterium]|nr:DUF3604 domain-containing protein [Acidobacteriota bacterium]